jgi:hypothetical protein
VRVPGPLEARARWEQRRRNRVRRWVRSQVPAVVRRLMRRMYAQAVHTGSGNAQAMLMARIMAPAAAAGGGAAARQAEAQEALPAPPQQPSCSPQLSPASARAPTPRGGAARGAAAAPVGACGGRLLRTLPGIVVDARDGPLEEVDDEQVKTVYAQCVAGACAALGLRYAGTGDVVVRDEILGHLTFACALREADSRDGYVFLERLLFGCTLLDGAAAVERGNALFAELMAGEAPAAAARGGAGPSPQHGAGGAMSVSPASSSPTGSSPTLPPSSQATPRAAAMRASAAAAAVNRMLLPAHETEPAADELVSAMAHRHPAWPLQLEAPGAGGGANGGSCGTGASRCLRAATLSPLDKRIRKPLPLAAAAALAPAREVLTSAIASCSLAAAFVMAGTADVAVLRVLRETRRRKDRAAYYGDAISTGIALGLLGLAGGRATLGRHPEAVASLLALLLPVWGHGSASQVYWPQCGRQLWPLAVERRLLDTADAETGEPVSLPLTVTVQVRPEPRGSRGGAPRPPQEHGEGEAAAEEGAEWLRTLSLRTPALLPEAHTIRRLQVRAAGYRPLDIAIDAPLAAIPQVLFVSRRPKAAAAEQHPSCARGAAAAAAAAGAGAWSPSRCAQELQGALAPFSAAPSMTSLARSFAQQLQLQRAHGSRTVGDSDDGIAGGAPSRDASLLAAAKHVLGRDLRL